MATSNAIAPMGHVVCKRTKPPPPTADAACIAIHDATQDRFLCKDQSKVLWLPIVEWLAQHLARRCQLVVPDCYVVELETNPGVYFFGSRWEGGAEAYSPGILSKVTNPKEFSSIFAFDLLIHNVDRHMNNYLYLQLAGDTVVKAMDHSRCMWFSGWPLPPPPPDPTSNTMRNAPFWMGEVGWDKTGAVQVVDCWKTISKLEVASILDAAPSAWVEPQKRQELVDWWGTPDWEARANLVAGAMP